MARSTGRQAKYAPHENNGCIAARATLTGSFRLPVTNHMPLASVGTPRTALTTIGALVKGRWNGHELRDARLSGSDDRG